MYADRFAPPRRIEPASLALAVGINAAVLMAVILAKPNLVKRFIDPGIQTYQVPTPPDPKPLPDPKPKQSTSPHQRPVTTTDPQIDTHPSEPGPTFPLDPGPPTLGGDGVGTGGPGIDIVIPPPLPLIDPVPDPRYAAALQPPYPPSEQRAGREGRVVLRVLVGTDGRVHQVEIVSATSDAFAAITQRQALERWRFKPAHRGDELVEAWRRMTVSFHLQGEDY